MNPTTHRTRGGASGCFGPFLPYIRGLGGGLLSAMLFLLIGAAIALASEDPTRLMAGLSLGALYLSSAICGIFSGWGEEDAPLLGAVSGGIYAGLLFLISLALSGDAPALPLAIALYAGIPLASFLGAALTRKRRRRPTLVYKKRRR